MRSLMITGLAGLLLMSACSQGGGQDDVTTAQAQPGAPQDESSLLNTVGANPEFSTLTRLMSEAGLSETVAGDGDFTLFAPTNTAFDKLSASGREGLGRPESREGLRILLRRHIVAERLTLADIEERAGAAGGAAVLTNLLGEPLTLRADEGQWRLSGARGGVSIIAMPDVIASNGVIHAVDTVLDANQIQ